MSELVRLEVDEATGVGTIRLDRPKMNAINEEVTEGLAEAAREATFNDKIKAVVLWGGEKIFAAGADIKMMADRTPAEMMNRIGMMQSVFSMIDAFRLLPRLCEWPERGIPSGTVPRRAVCGPPA